MYNITYLVDSLLQLQSCLHGLESRSPVLLHRAWDVVQHDATTTLILKLHQLLSVLTLLLAGFAKELLEARQSHIVTVEMKSLQRKLSIVKYN